MILLWPRATIWSRQPMGRVPAQSAGALAGVYDVAAVPVPDPQRGEEVKVIVVREPGAELTPEQVVAWAREGLAPFQGAEVCEFRAELPYTPSGKTHKAAVKEEERPFHEGVTDTTA